MKTFPQDFLWGASTASYQIEGATDQDGCGTSIWDTFAATPGKVFNRDNGSVACDHYHRYPEDIALLKNMGAKVYRFSSAWPRIQAEGTGPANPKGLAFYDRLVDATLEAGIEPWLCLYHWDLPQALQDKGGWANRDIVGWFTDYAEIMTRALGDRVPRICTFNEPNIFSLIGYMLGRHAPGLTDERATLRAIHHINMAHGSSVAAMRAIAPNIKYGIIPNLHPMKPATASAADAQAAKDMDMLWNRGFRDVLIKGEYPAQLAALLQEKSGAVHAGDLQTICQPLDWLGFNHYSYNYVKANTEALFGVELVDPPAGSPVTDMGWEIAPAAFKEVLLQMRDEFGNPELYVTENGCASADVLVDGVCDDPARVDYLRQYLSVASDAVAEGVNLKGYLVWSLLDNYEWSYGYSKRFGIVHVDYATQKRTPKTSYTFLQKTIANQTVA
jgi:beta-glucosidase